MTDTVSKAAVGFERIREILETESAVRDLPRARRARASRAGSNSSTCRSGTTPDQLMLKDVSFTIEPGQVAAFVGPTGGGKTTHRQPDCALLRSRSPGRSRSTARTSATSHQVAARSDQLRAAGHASVPRAVWQNIAYGRPEARRAEIMRAAELANADEFIEEMPEGYDTMVGERGVTLSGGQRQRIAIARAVIRNTPILILDEPTSGLDAQSEQAVMEALERLMKNKTSHRHRAPPGHDPPRRHDLRHEGQ